MKPKAYNHPPMGHVLNHSNPFSILVQLLFGHTRISTCSLNLSIGIPSGLSTSDLVKWALPCTSRLISSVCSTWPYLVFLDSTTKNSTWRAVQTVTLSLYIIPLLLVSLVVLDSRTFTSTLFWHTVSFSVTVREKTGTTWYKLMTNIEVFK